MNHVTQPLAPQDLTDLPGLESNPLYPALKLALGTIALQDFNDAKRIAQMARDAVREDADRLAMQPTPQDPVSPLLNPEELAALNRFYECALDGEGYDVPDQMMRRLAEIGVLRRRSGAYFQTTDFGDAVLAGTVQIAASGNVNDALQPSGWLYISDDGHGPFFTASKRNADRYLHSWQVFKRAPDDGHVCDYKGSYGVCTQCESLQRAAPPASTDSPASLRQTSALTLPQTHGIDAAVERAHDDLPEYFIVHVDLKRGESIVRLHNGLVDDESGDFTGDTLADQINSAVDAALRKAAPGAE